MWRGIPRHQYVHTYTHCTLVWTCNGAGLADPAQWGMHTNMEPGLSLSDCARAQKRKQRVTASVWSRAKGQRTDNTVNLGVRRWIYNLANVFILFRWTLSHLQLCITTTALQLILHLSFTSTLNHTYLYELCSCVMRRHCTCIFLVIIVQRMTLV